MDSSLFFHHHRILISRTLFLNKTYGVLRSKSSFLPVQKNYVVHDPPFFICYHIWCIDLLSSFYIDFTFVLDQGLWKIKFKNIYANSLRH